MPKQPLSYITTLLLIFSSSLFSCISSGTAKSESPPQTAAFVYPRQATYRFTPYIRGRGQTVPADLEAFLEKYNPALPKEKIKQISSIYIEESLIEEINHDIAFAQMCLETGFLKYGGQVKPEQNNFCGLGALDGGAEGAHFPTIQQGVRAHIQHLKAYATTREVKEEIIDPRFHLVKRGSAETIYDLTGKWATDPEYGDKIESLIVRLLKVRKNRLEFDK